MLGRPDVTPPHPPPFRRPWLRRMNLAWPKVFPISKLTSLSSVFSLGSSPGHVWRTQPRATARVSSIWMSPTSHARHDVMSPSSAATPASTPRPPSPSSSPSEASVLAGCCPCGKCRWCCSCCLCRDPLLTRANHAKWFKWLLSSVASPGAVVGAAGGSAGSCARCGQAFSIFFKKRVQCGGGCGLPVCRKCAPWSTAAKAYVCGVCSSPQPQETREPRSPDDAHLKQVEESVRSHIEALVEGQVGGPLDHVTAAPTTTHSHHDPYLSSPGSWLRGVILMCTLMLICTFVLTLVSALTLVCMLVLSCMPLLTCMLMFMCMLVLHVAERDLFSRHHAGLSQALARLSYSLQMSILNRPLPPEDLPTTRHAQLSQHVTRAIKDAMILPSQTEGYDPAVSPETPVEDFNSHTYEDILATAILNKVLESCEGGRPDEVTIEVSHDVTSTDTDSGMSGGAKESRRGRHKRGEVSEAGSEGSEERSLTPPLHSDCRPPTVSPDQGVVTDDCWAGAVSDGPPLQFKIEEHVEEITTHHLTDDDQDLEGTYDDDISDSGGSWQGSRCSLDDPRGTKHHKKVTHHSVTEEPLLSTINVALPDPAHITSRRVSFPELGADILHDSCSNTECCEVGPGDMVVDSDTWEENWLFRRHRLVGAAATEPVTMLIPNPEAHVPATVGNRDVDELSELSEQHSFCSGEPWSTSESEGEGELRETFQPYAASRELSTLAGEIVAEFAQQDQEYTVDYSVPSRVTATYTTQQGTGRKPPHSSPQTKTTHSQKSSGTHMWTQCLDRNHKEVPRGYHDGKTVEGVRNLGITEKPQTDPDFISDNERPVPKPRKLSLAMVPPSKTSFKSPVQIHPSLAEDLTILSPPLGVPHPKNASSESETVWFVETPEDFTVMQGRTLRLECQVNAKKPMGLSWYQNGSLVPVGDCDHWTWRQGSTHHLHVYGITPAAAGVYAAAAYTATDCVWAFCRVQHKASSRPQKRPTFTKGLSDISIEEGGELYIQCQVQGHPEPRVIFSRGLERLEPSSRVAIESDQYGTWTLRLRECTTADSGEISATAANMKSTITSRCKVRVVPEGTPVPQQDHTNHERLQSSNLQSNKQHIPRPGSRHKKKIHDPGSLPSNTTWPSSESLLTSAKILPPSLQGNSTASPGVSADVNDLDDIQRIPTRPDPSTPSSLTAYKLHASSMLRDHHQEYEECTQGDEPFSPFQVATSQSPPGTIAEREHRKWEAAVPLPNNPYAPERLVHRLSHARVSDHTTHPRRALSIELAEEGERELDPSLRDGVPPKPDLNRYSRDYYVAPATNIRSSQHFMHQKSQQHQIHHPKQQQQKPWQQHQQEQQQSHRSLLQSSSSEHPAVLRTSPEPTTHTQVHSQVPCKDTGEPCMSSSQNEKLMYSSTFPEMSISSGTSSYLSLSHNSTNAHNTNACITTSCGGASDKCTVKGSDIIFSHIIDRFNKRSGFLTKKEAERTKFSNNLQYGMTDDSELTSPVMISHTTLDQRSLTFTCSLTPTCTSAPTHSISVQQSSTCTQSSKSSCSSISSDSITHDSSPLSKLVTPVSPEDVGIRELEDELIHHDFSRSSFRSLQASKSFSLNPLFEDELKTCSEIQGVDNQIPKSNNSKRFTASHLSEPSSDYYSSYESLPYLSSFSREGSLKLPNPQVTMEAFESFSEMGGSMRQPKKKTSLKPWGSFKHKKTMMF